jgi:hypothetical protein
VPVNLLDNLNKLLAKDGVKSIEIKNKSQDRSLSANGYLWVLIDQLSKKLTIPKGDLYVKMIKRYGTFNQLIIKDEALTKLIKNWDNSNTSVEHTESLCEVTKSFRKNSTLWHQVTCHDGSSNYNKIDFSNLLKGLISECELIGVQTMTPNEINRLMQNYEGD